TQSQRVISNFLASRAGVLSLDDLDLVRRLSRRVGGANFSGPFNFAANGTPEHFNLAFAGSLSDMAGDASGDGQTDALDQVMAYSHRGRGGKAENAQHIAEQQAGTPASRLDVWFEGQWAHVNDETRKSNIGVLYLDADYVVDPSVVVGLLAQFDRMGQKDATAGTAAGGTGWMAGPYIVARFHDNLYFDGRAAWGRSSNTTSPLGTFTDTFATDRWLAKGKLTGDFRAGDWRFNPYVAVVYFSERQKAYTSGGGGVVPSQVISLGRVSFGPQVSHVFRNNGVEVEPHLGIRGIWDFDKAGIVDLATGLAAGSSAALRARAEGGIAFRSAGGSSLVLEGFYDGIGATGLDMYGATARLKVPLR
ncbi:MAG: autotransporter outer membrane beta-barrel domain-containing protein, partial [Alphaproteobacteria bacterium]